MAMVDTIECPNCLDVPAERQASHWKQFERARFPSYNRNRSIFARMLTQVYEIGIGSVRESLSFEDGIGRARAQIQRNAPEIISDTYQRVYEETALDFAKGFEANLKQLTTEDEQDLATLTLLAVRDYLTLGLFNRQEKSLQQHINDITNSHAGIFASTLKSQAVQMLGIDPSQPIPQMSINDLNKLALATRSHLRNNVIPTHSRYFSTTETVAASNLGTLAVARAEQARSGVMILKGWLSQRDARVRLTHEGADGDRLPLSGLFRVGNSLLAFPGDWTHGAMLEEIINCRCVLVYFRQS